MTPTVPQVLRKAARQIRDKGWMRLGPDAISYGPEPADLTKAIWRACEPDDIAHPVFGPALDAAVLSLGGSVEQSPRFLWEWNDRTCRDGVHAAEELEIAAARYEERWA